MAKRYARLNWQNKPSVATPINATNLNKMDKGIDDIDTALNNLENSIVGQIVNDPTKINNAAVNYSLKQSIDTINNNLANIYEAVVSGVLSTTEQSLGSITVPPGIYIIYAAVNMSGITFTAFHVRTSDGTAISASTNGSNKSTVFKQFNTETTISLNATGTGTITADIRYNAIRAIRIK